MKGARELMDERAERVLAQIRPEAIVALASDLIRIPSFKTEETPIARWLAEYFAQRGYEVDLQEVEPIAGAEIHQLDFLADDADEKVKGWLGGRADVVMSDMAAAASGHKATDHLRIVALVEAALAFAFDVLEDDGTFVAKVLAGGAENEMQTMLKRNFRKVANVKPPASRADSSEKFVVAMGFRGRQVEGGAGQDDPEAGPLG